MQVHMGHGNQLSELVLSDLDREGFSVFATDNPSALGTK